MEEQDDRHREPAGPCRTGEDGPCLEVEEGAGAGGLKVTMSLVVCYITLTSHGRVLSLSGSLTA